MNSILTLKIYFVLLSVICLLHVDSKFLLKPIKKSLVTTILSLQPEKAQQREINSFSLGVYEATKFSASVSHP